MSVSEANQRTGAFRPTPLFSVEAQQLLAAGRLKQAVEICKRGLVYFPEHIMGYVVLSQAYLALGQQPRALNVLRDGYRRTGAEQLDVLRARMSGEIPLIDEIPQVVGDQFESTPATSQTVARSNGIGASKEISPIEEPQAAITKSEPIVSEPAPSTDQAPVPTVPSPSPAEELSEKQLPVLKLADRESRTPSAKPAQDSTETVTPQPLHGAEVIAEKVTGEMVSSDIEVMAEPKPERSPANVAASQPEAQRRDEQDVLKKPEVAVPAKTLSKSGPTSEPNEKAEPKPTSQSKLEPATKGPTLRLASEPERNEPAATSDGGGEKKRPEHPGTPQPESGPRTIGMLALHKGSSVSRLRSSNLRLIPGLEFAPLRQEDNQRRQPIAPLINEPMPEPFIRPRTKKPETKVPHSSLPSLEESVARERIVPPMFSTPTKSTTLSTQKIDPQPPTVPEAPAPETPPTSKRTATSPSFTKLANTYMPEKRGEELTPLEELARRLESARIPVLEEEEPARPTTYESTIVSDTLANILVAQGAYAEALKAFQTLARTKPERLDYYEQRITEMKERMQNGSKSRSGPVNRDPEE